MLSYPSMSVSTESFHLRQHRLDILLGKFFAIELIVAPGSTLRLPLIVNQDPHALSLGLIKVRHEGFLLTLQVSAPPFLWGKEIRGIIPDQLNAFFATPFLEATGDKIINDPRHMNASDFSRQTIQQIMAVRFLLPGIRQADVFNLKSNPSEVINILQPGLPQ